MKQLVAILALAVAAFCPSIAKAFLCSNPGPFDDVPQTASYCSNVEWLLNRSITLGCDAAHFCPDQFVTRAQMALFINRLADHIIEEPAIQENILGAMTLPSSYPGTILCSRTIPAVAYPRSIILSAHVSLLSAAGQATVAMTPVASDNGGATWVSFNAGHERVGFDATYWGYVGTPATFTLPAGYTWTVGIGTYSIAGATAMAAGRCHLLVQAQSASGVASPYDLEADATATTRGGR